MLEAALSSDLLVIEWLGLSWPTGLQFGKDELCGGLSGSKSEHERSSGCKFYGIARSVTLPTLKPEHKTSTLSLGYGFH